jgi:oxalate decarboxylase/phosphoglucose isomerase-like protein (cupin superfamily)
MRISTLQIAICGLTAMTALAVEPGAKLFQNEDVNVIRALEKAHVKGKFHEHKPNRVMVYLQAGEQRFEYQDSRKPEVFHWKPGQVVWSPADGMHAPEVTGDEPFNIVEVELLKPGAGVAAGDKDALKLDKKHYKVELDNDQVRVLRLKLAPKESTPMIERTRKSVAIAMSESEAKMTDGTGNSQAMKQKPGDSVWLTPGASKLENTGTQPLEMVLVELKY